MIWAKAEGCRVTLADRRELLDVTAGFGVAALGDRNPRIDGAHHGAGLLALAATGFPQFEEPWRDWLPVPCTASRTGRIPGRSRTTQRA